MVESDAGNCSPRYVFAESNTGRIAVHHSRVSRTAWRDAMVAFTALQSVSCSDSCFCSKIYDGWIDRVKGEVIL